MEYPNVVFFLKKRIDDLKNSPAIRGEIKEDAIAEFGAAIDVLKNHGE